MEGGGLTNVYVGKYFNRFLRGQIKEDMLKRVISMVVLVAVSSLNSLTSFR